MKNKTIAQRLTVTLNLIILMLLAGIGLTWWLERHVAQEESAREHMRETSCSLAPPICDLRWCK